MEEERWAKYARLVLERGFCVVPLDGACLAALRDASNIFRERPPEKTTVGVSSYPLPPGVSQIRHGKVVSRFTGNNRHIAPGFGASSLPSTIHDPGVRKLHGLVADRLDRLLANLAGLPGTQQALKANGARKGDPVYASHGKDRVLERLAGRAPGRETPHRDISYDTANPARSQIVMGGFINANEDPRHAQHFSLVPGSQRLCMRAGMAAGFYVLGDDDVPPESEWELVTVLPGEMIVINENVVHRVLGKRLPYDIRRFFITCRLWAGAPPCGTARGSPCNAPDRVKGRPGVTSCFACEQRDDCYAGQFNTIKSGQKCGVLPNQYFVALKGFLPYVADQVPGIVAYDEATGEYGYTNVHPPVDVEPYTEGEIGLVVGRRISEIF